MLLNLHQQYIQQLKLQISMNNNELFSENQEFNRYKIPPDFEVVQIHRQAAFIYDQKSQYRYQCPCCLRRVGSKKVPLCVGTESFLRISPQIPLYFSYIKVILLVLFIFAAALGGQKLFSHTTTPVRFQLKPPDSDIIQLEIGFIETRRQIRFLFFIIFTCLILFARGYLKKSKYQVINISKKLSDRSIMLTNLKRNVTVQQIRQKFDKFQIQNIELTYKVRDYIDNLQKVYRLKKACKMAKKKNKSEKYLTQINKSLSQKTQQIKFIKERIKSKQNRLDFAFVTFADEYDRNKFLQKYQTSLFSRLYFKFSTCCSSTAIRGQHINVFPGPDPQDIDWLNLEQGYWIKKMHRFACYYMSFSILIFGILIQYEISTFPVQQLYVSIIKNLVIFIGNFLVVNLLEFTTYQIEKHQKNTNKVISLVRKLTFFVFLNLSMSPFSIYLYYQFSSNNPINPEDTPFDQLCLSILIICIGNIFKPLTEYFHLGRIFKWIGFYYQRCRGQDCPLSQEQANTQYEPIPYPLASFYSLFLSALFLTSFFLSSFQSIIAVQLLSCIILYLISKYMLLRNCKEPIGLNHIISVLCQKLLVLCIPIYWIGDKIMYFILTQTVFSNQNQAFNDYLSSQLEIYTIIQMSLIVFIGLFSSKILSKISHKVAGEGESITESFVRRVNDNQNKMTYADVNSIKQLQDQLTKYIDLVNDNQ